MQISGSYSITTFSVFRYTGAAQWWALKQMGILPPRLRKVKGLAFFKLMGSGKGPAFSIAPDFSRYALMAVWNSQEEAEAFLHSSEIIHTIKSKAEEVWTITLAPIQSHGRWDGVNPFHDASFAILPDMPVAVLTRASLKWHLLFEFCKHAMDVSESVGQARGLLFSCGIGERPLTRQATFSIWKNLEAMKAFAYGAQDHKSVIREKHRQGWYSEELFARFGILATEGSYLGQDPVKEHLKQMTILQPGAPIP